MNDEGPRLRHLTKPAQLHDCNDGWICEQHPAHGWPHDDCPILQADFDKEGEWDSL